LGHHGLRVLSGVADEGDLSQLGMMDVIALLDVVEADVGPCSGNV
jgi:hypothetical protein